MVAGSSEDISHASQPIFTLGGWRQTFSATCFDPKLAFFLHMRVRKAKKQKKNKKNKQGMCKNERKVRHLEPLLSVSVMQI